MDMLKFRKISGDQRGMAAIAVTVVLMFVVSIIVLGFAQTVRREQRNALDNQLSTQAYYAAEAGVNYAQTVAKGMSGIIDKNDCAPDTQFSDYSIGENAELTCLLVTNRVQTLEYQSLDMKSVPLLIKSETGSINNLHISWQSPSNPASTSGCTNSTLPADAFPSPWNCAQSILRLDLVPVSGSMTAASVENSQFTVFLYPTRNASDSISYSTGNGAKGQLKRVRCSTPTLPLRPKLCTGVISGLGDQAYAARMMSVYGTADVTLLATDGATPKFLIEGQLEIDATAKTADVLKRVKARVPLSNNLVPDFALSSAGGICKRYQIAAGADVSIANQADHPACSIP